MRVSVCQILQYMCNISVSPSYALRANVHVHRAGSRSKVANSHSTLLTASTCILKSVCSLTHWRYQLLHRLSWMLSLPVYQCSILLMCHMPMFSQSLCYMGCIRSVMHYVPLDYCIVKTSDTVGSLPLAQNTQPFTSSKHWRARRMPSLENSDGAHKESYLTLIVEPTSMSL